MRVSIALLLASPIIISAVLALALQPLQSSEPSNPTILGFFPVYTGFISILIPFLIPLGLRGLDRRATLTRVSCIIGAVMFLFILTSLPPTSGIPAKQTFVVTQQSCTDVLNANNTYVQRCSSVPTSTGYFYGSVVLDLVFWLSVVGLIVIGSFEVATKSLERAARQLVCSLYASAILVWPFGYTSGFPIATSVYLPQICASYNLGLGYWCYGLSGTALVCDFLFWFGVALGATLGLRAILGLTHA